MGRWGRRSPSPSRRRPRPVDWRTALAGVDPGLVRLRLASIAVVSMMFSAGVTELVRALFAPSEPVTVLLFAGVVAMISNLAVTESDLARQRGTTALMALPAVAATVAGTLLSPYRIVADVVFVLVMMVAVYVRRYGPRGFALGQIAFMAFFFTQFLQVQPAQLPWLVVAVVTGLASTLLLRGLVFAERHERTLRRLVAAFRAREHALVLAVDDVLVELAEAAGDPDGTPGPDDAVLERMRRARARLNDVALQLEDQLEQVPARRVWPGLDNATLALRVFDAELALERLSVSTRRLVRPPEGGASDQRPDALALTALRVGLARLRDALSSRTEHDAILAAADDARAAVAGLVAVAGTGQERVQRTAFAVRRVADAVHHAQRDAPARGPGDGRDDGHDGASRDPGHDDARRPPDDPPPDEDDDAAPGAAPRDGLLMSTRQAVQVGVATSLAIGVGELIAPSRWYWAVIAAFVIFTGTQSRGDLLGRSWGRVLGTIGGVAAGMGLAALVGGEPVPSLILLFACVFLALYLVRVSPALLAFWITAVLALVYGLIGQFSVQVLVLRIEETAAGAAAAVLAAFLVLPKGTRAAFGDAVDDLVDAMDDVLDGAVERLVGRSRSSTLERAREMDTALQTLRARARPLTAPTPRRRGRSSYQRGLRVLVVCDHYLRSLVRVADTVTDPGWEPTLRPAAERVRANLDGLRDVLVRGRRRSDGQQVLAQSAESLVDAAEAYAARTAEHHAGRAERLTAARLLRRIDQAVVGLAVDLGAADDTERGQRSSAASAGLTNTPSGS